MQIDGKNRFNYKFLMFIKHILKQKNIKNAISYLFILGWDKTRKRALTKLRLPKPVLIRRKESYLLTSAAKETQKHQKQVNKVQVQLKCTHNGKLI